MNLPTKVYGGSSVSHFYSFFILFFRTKLLFLDDDPRFTQERSPQSPVFNDTGDLDLEYPRLNEELAGEADADGELDPDVEV